MRTYVRREAGARAWHARSCGCERCPRGQRHPRMLRVCAQCCLGPRHPPLLHTQYRGRGGHPPSPPGCTDVQAPPAIPDGSIPSPPLAEAAETCLIPHHAIRRRSRQPARAHRRPCSAPDRDPPLRLAPFPPRLPAWSIAKPRASSSHRQSHLSSNAVPVGSSLPLLTLALVLVRVHMGGVFGGLAEA